MYVETAAPATELDKVLQDVNRIRAAHGFSPLSELPKGRCSDIRGCVLARAFSDFGLDVYVGSDDLTALGPFGRTVVDLPDRLCRFIKAFDDDQYPHLKEAA